jgi:hypothetical protein
VGCLPCPSAHEREARHCSQLVRVFSFSFTDRTPSLTCTWGSPPARPFVTRCPFPPAASLFAFWFVFFFFSFSFSFTADCSLSPTGVQGPPLAHKCEGGLYPFFHDTMLFRSQMQGTMPHPPGSFFSLFLFHSLTAPLLSHVHGDTLASLPSRVASVASPSRIASISSPLFRRPRHVALVVSPSPPLHRPHRVAVASIASPSPCRPGLPASSEWLAPWCDARDNKHPETDVQDLNVSHTAYNFLCLLIIIIRKKAGATEKVIGTGGSGPSGMTDFMKELAIEGLAGRVYR